MLILSPSITRFPTNKILQAFHIDWVLVLFLTLSFFLISFGSCLFYVFYNGCNLVVTNIGLGLGLARYTNLAEKSYFS